MTVPVVVTVRPAAREFILVFDAPVRLFHWMLAAAFLTALALATLASDDGPLFPLHMLLGLVVVFMVVLRIVWGFVGSRYARFASFPLAPGETFAYLRSILSRSDARYVGHNPATSWATLAMLLLFGGIAVTGWRSASAGEAFEEVHEVLAWVTFGIAAVHIAGVAWHVLRTRENLVGSMITGRKDGVRAEAIHSTRAIAAVAFLLLTGAWTAALASGYDRGTRQLTVPLTGVTLRAGDDAERATEQRAPSGESEEHEDDD